MSAFGEASHLSLPAADGARLFTVFFTGFAVSRLLAIFASTRIKATKWEGAERSPEDTELLVRFVSGASTPA